MHGTPALLSDFTVTEGHRLEATSAAVPGVSPSAPFPGVPIWPRFPQGFSGRLVLTGPMPFISELPSELAAALSTCRHSATTQFPVSLWAINQENTCTHHTLLSVVLPRVIPESLGQHGVGAPTQVTVRRGSALGDTTGSREGR